MNTLTWLTLLTWLAAVVVLAEGLNKLDRADVFAGQRGWMPRLRGIAWLAAPWRWKRTGVQVALKVCGWALISVGAAGFLVTPLLSAPWLRPDGFVLVGFSLLVIRLRIVEG